jgi:anaerobic C4-dicarboxylate transporter
VCGWGGVEMNSMNIADIWRHDPVVVSLLAIVVACLLILLAGADRSGR